ncbi:MAG: hypothetical protein JSS49_07070 [Planctomycetes bacterium]|nr:hypothetical protein [Planctomycetota bacterium]
MSVSSISSGSNLFTAGRPPLTTNATTADRDGHDADAATANPDASATGPTPVARQLLQLIGRIISQHA